MRWLNRLDAACRPMDTRYAQWFARRFTPAADGLFAVVVPAIIWLALLFGGVSLLTR